MTTMTTATWTKKREILRAGDLEIDPKVQRDVHPAQVRTLNRDWDEMLVGTLIGWRKDDGIVYLLDGQQRLRAKTGHTLVPFTTKDARPADPDYMFDVEVYENITEKQAAHIFLGANRGRKTVDAYARWWVELTEGDPIALSMERAAKRVGLKIGANSSKYEISCVSTLRRVIARKTPLTTNEDALVWALEVYRDSFGYSPAWRSEIVEGLAMLKLRYPKANQGMAITRFKGLETDYLLGQARMRTLGSNRVSNAMTEVLVVEYDRGRRSGRLVPKD
jgi:hypothetical protein